MNNGSLNTNGNGTQIEATVQRVGGKLPLFARLAVSCPEKKNPVFCSQIFTTSC